eukprot:TRINITY_DN71790_c0_g1_i1.p1 TRINITY_DN71790_c0_g1~~TRINITY_DN71790_c0_g1_i1.p1  ORF type:complete len:142 (-),score=32.77 TRINITY_DN71790_c0_g1_i1:71-475(-)
MGNAAGKCSSQCCDKTEDAGCSSFAPPAEGLVASHKTMDGDGPAASSGRAGGAMEPLVGVLWKRSDGRLLGSISSCDGDFQWDDSFEQHGTWIEVGPEHGTLIMDVDGDRYTGTINWDSPTMIEWSDGDKWIRC